MSHPAYTVFEMSIMTAGQNPSSLGSARGRWRLHRAGIVNVYQYEDEVLHFGGGRLLLRGVNGSGKSTAMNMLLPFLLTTRQARIDAAGEQRGILKSWMLNGRDDAQPVGYLWIEFERAGRFLVCGCGIKANRQSDTVRTWWFVTEKRPGIDFPLVERGGVPLSATRLRAILEPDEVFGERRRKDYRRVIEQRLFGGASISQHIRLIDRVRTPRVGDRIDVDLPAYLVAALPQLSEQALVEAASPLDDLEEHRRNVAELEKTSVAIRGLLDVYRSYCLTELRRWVTTGRDHLDALRRCARDEKATHRAAEEAASEVERLDRLIGGLEDDTRRLRSEIAGCTARARNSMRCAIWSAISPTSMRALSVGSPAADSEWRPRLNSCARHRVAAAPTWANSTRAWRRCSSGATAPGSAGDRSGRLTCPSPSWPVSRPPNQPASSTQRI